MIVPSDKILLSTFDMTGLYTNIIHDEGLKARQNILETRENESVPTGFLMRMIAGDIVKK